MDETKNLVLVVEDEKLLRDAIVKKLKILGFQVLESGSGEEALTILKSAEVLPGVIWLDYYLPDMNGMEFMQQVNSSNTFMKIPVVVVSNSASPDIVEKMLELGVKEFLLKVDKKLEDIIRVVSTFMK